MINFHNKYGQPDLSLIDPDAVSKLSDEEQQVLAVVVETVQRREAAQVRFCKAQEAVREAMRREIDTLAAHQAANPPMSQLEALRAAQAAYNASNN